MIDGFYEDKSTKFYIDMKAKLFGFSVLFIVTISATAQNTPGWNWPEDRATAEEKNVIYTDMMKLGNYKESIYPPLWFG